MRITAPASSPTPKKYFKPLSNEDWTFFVQSIKYPMRMTRIKRSGKFILVQFTHDESDPKNRMTWSIHLNSTGWFMPHNNLAEKSCRVDEIYQNFLHKVEANNIRMYFHLSDGQVWSYHDARTWGKWHIHFGHKDFLEGQILVPDVVEDPEGAARRIRSSNGVPKNGTKRKAKTVLTDQHFLLGIGNYLSCEILHRAKIHPHREWRSLSTKEREAIANATTETVEESLKNDDHRHWKVFKKEGQNCTTCNVAKVSYVKDGNSARGSYFCPNCQVL